MPPRTVRVPPELEPLFTQAEQAVDAYFADWRERVGKSLDGTLGSGYVLVRGASLSVAFFQVVRDLFGADRQEEADRFSRHLLFDLAHAVGRSDASAFQEQMGIEDPMARLAAGPVHFAMTGWAMVDVHPASHPSADDDYFLLYDHLHSFEADAWIDSGKPSHVPVCIMNSGYSAGWCEASFGIRLVAAEISCRAAGDEHCRFAMAHPDHLESKVRDWVAGSPHERPWVVPDLFGRKRLEEELRRSRDELERRVDARTAELEAANQALIREMDERHAAEERLRIAQKLDAVGRLAGGVAHDFNNLLTVVLGNAELLSTLVENPDARELVEHIRTAAERAADLTHQLLAVGRRQPRHPRVLDLNEVVRGMARLLERVLRADIAMVLDLDPAGAAVTADPGQVEQVLLNLAVNARDAMPGGGRLLLTTRAYPATSAGAGRVVLQVRDDGAGMDTNTRARIFEPFFTTKAPGEGTGLGLAIVYGIVQQSGGHIEVESRVGSGTTFAVHLPQASGVAQPTLPQLTRPSARGNAHILVVEDEPALLELARIALTHSGFTVYVASDGEEAWAQWQRHTVDLLFTDVRMPGASGVEIAQRCRLERPSLPVIFASGYTEEEVLDGAPTERAVFLPKPYRLSTLLSLVADMLADQPGS
ncbi:MAG: two-component system cell cycle sensor histidine kinase/response regulator CckA [Myxococcota bacterium]|jgi:two-component system cell cycle sensor histidine kinase/response regulator CckA